MARKGEFERLLEELTRLPWWVSVGASATAYIAFGFVLPTVRGNVVVSGVMSAIAVPIAVVLLLPTPGLGDTRLNPRACSPAGTGQMHAV